MEVTLVYPQGFCRGVIQAISLTKKTLTDKSIKKPVYILGNIVHNKHISLAFKNLGLITITKDDIKNQTISDLSEIYCICFCANGIRWHNLSL